MLCYLSWYPSCTPSTPSAPIKSRTGIFGNSIAEGVQLPSQVAVCLIKGFQVAGRFQANPAWPPGRWLEQANDKRHESPRRNQREQEQDEMGHVDEQLSTLKGTEEPE
jgi:hypothetical protein